MDPRQNRLDNDSVVVTGQRLVSGVALVDVRGEIDGDTAPDVEAVVRSKLVEQPSSLVLNLTGVTFMASAGLNLLVALKIDCARLGIDLRLVATSKVVLRPMELTDLTSQFVIVASVEAAEAS